MLANYSSRHHCTFEHLLSTEKDALNMMSNMISPLQVETFFGKHFEVQSTAVLSRPQDFYSRLINIGVVADYLRSQGQLSRHTSEGSDPHIKDNSRKPSSSLEGTEIHHGGDWKLVKRVWKNGSWWSSTPNISMIPFEVVFASFQRHGYSIVIDKMQNFHPPLRIVTGALESLFGHRVNANLYLTPNGVKQAFETHFDWMDGIVLQITGCKSWKVSTTRSTPRPLPDTVFKLNENERKKENTSSNTSKFLLFDDYKLASGSILYVPRGFAHEAATNCTSTSTTQSNEVNDADIGTDGGIRESRASNIDGSSNTDNRSSSGDRGSGSGEESVGSLHITFGLEAATDTTVEIFLHSYVDTFFDLHNNTGVINSNEEYLMIKLTTKASNISMHVDDMSVRDLYIRDMSVRNLYHLIVHVAAVLDKDAVQCYHSTTHRNVNSNSSQMRMENCKKHSDFQRYLNQQNKNSAQKSIQKLSEKNYFDSLLRRAVAVTEFTARNKYQPLLYEILPDAVHYMKSFLSFYSTSEILIKVLQLCEEVKYLSIDMSDDLLLEIVRNNSEKMGATKGKNVNLSYLKYYMTSSAILYSVSGTDRTYVHNNENMGIRSGSIRRAMLLANDWFRSYLLNGAYNISIHNEKGELDLFTTLTLFLDGLDEKNETGEKTEAETNDQKENENEVLCAGGELLQDCSPVKLQRKQDNIITPPDLYCKSWERMTSRLKAERADRK